MTKDELIQEAYNLLRRVDSDRRQYDIDVWLRLHITIAQLKSMFFISNRGSTSLGKLATALGVTPTNTTGIVDRLVKRGLITRTESKEDRRVLVLRTTARGEQLVNTLRQRRRDHVYEVLARMTDDELSALNGCLRALVRALQEHEEATARKA
jgi:DNA-binding MarR family transcriptional regulator